jgi:hypothetical protein
MAKTAKKEVATKSPRTHRVSKVSDAVANTARTKKLADSADALVNAHNAADTAGDAVSAARQNFFAECKQSFGSKFYEDKKVLNQPRAIFYTAHYKSKGFPARVTINASRGTLAMEAIDPTHADNVKAEAAHAGTRWNHYLTWCKDFVAGKFDDKDPNKRQSGTKNKKTVQEIVQDHGQRCYNACYKNDLKQASVELQAWATKWFKSKVKYAVPAGQK